MRKYTLTTLLACCILCTKAQLIHEVVNAEKAFAQHAIDASVKKAFLHYMDSNAVVFHHGQVLNGLQHWQTVPESKTALLWKPVFAAIAASGELGFTTGPYEIRRQMNDTAFGAGQYSTVWKKNRQGEWKFLADMGTRYFPSQFNTTASSFFNELTPATDTSVLQLEKQFIAAYTINGVAGYTSYLCDQSWFNIDRHPPCTGKEQIMQGLSRVPAGILFQPLATGIAESKDLAWCYGQTLREGKTENYLRIWAHTKEGWKILLQVLCWQ